MSNITRLPAWQGLADLRDGARDIKSLFAADPARVRKFSVTLPGLLADFSKNNISSEALDQLIVLAEQAGLAEARDKFFAGEKVNVTENRSVLHMALRAPGHVKMSADGAEVTAGVQETLTRMKFFANGVRGGEWRGYGGKPITDIVNIGIGGSTLGPQLVTEALSAWHHPRLKCHYVANVEASDLARALSGLSPETTLFIVASKTFTTSETMLNARLAREWLLAHYQGDAKAVASHFVAASTNASAVKSFGIAEENMFPFAEWVGGRYSVWSSIGLSCLVMAGPERFAEFLAGGHEIDEHFRTAPFARNVPVLMALTGLWHRNVMDCSAAAVIPYHAVLRRLPSFLQQLDMESNGKSVTRGGKPVPLKTSPVIFGEPGTDAQHSFFQWLHQGPDIVPVDFIAAVKTSYDTPRQRRVLLANLLAQSEALMIGADSDDPHRRFAGNRPSTTLLFDTLDPRSVGMLITLYEHKVFTQGVLWGINSFDQYGVELGKTLARRLEADIDAGELGQHDDSTWGLLDYIFTHTYPGAGLEKEKRA